MEIIAEKRETLGKENKKIRKIKKIPAVIFGKGIDPVNIVVGLLEFTRTYKETGESTLIDLKLDGKTEKVLISEIQVHPVTLEPIHANFHKVNLKEKIKANVPVETLNVEKNPFVKTGEGLILTLINEIEVEALPTDLPHKFEIDVAELKLGEGVTIGQLNFDRSKVEIVDFDDEEMVVKLDTSKMEEETEVAATEEELIAGVEATAEKKPEEETQEE